MYEKLFNFAKVEPSRVVNATKKIGLRHKYRCNAGHHSTNRIVCMKENYSAKVAEPTPDDCRFMQMAIDLSVASVANGGGPFGAVIVRNGEVLATGTNSVTESNDPTAHAEVNAIRAACVKIGHFKLDGCTVYSSCEPCPMCLSALYWAGVERLFYGNTKADAKAIDFDDSFIYDEIAKPYTERSIPSRNIMREEALRAFRAWEAKPDKIKY